MEITNSCQTVSDCLDALLPLIRGFVGCSAAAMLLPADRERPLGSALRWAAVDALSHQTWDTERTIRLDDGGVCALVASRALDPGSPFTTPGGALAIDTEERRQAATLHGLPVDLERQRSLAIVPVRHGDQLAGLLLLADPEPGMMPRERLGVIESMSPRLGMTIDRLQTRAELARERERLEVTLRSIGDGVISTDADGRVASLNDVAQELTGWAEAEAIGRPLTQVFCIHNEVSGEACEDIVERVLSTGLVVGLANNTVLVARDGAERIIADSAAPIHSPGGEVLGVALVFRDVTAERQAEERIESLSRFPSENPNPVLRVAADLTTIYANAAAQELLATLGAGVGEPVPEAWRTWIEGALHGGRGETIDVTAAGRVFSFACAPVAKHGYANLYGRDVTERRRAEEALRASEERYRSLYASMAEGVALHEIVHDDAGEAIDYRILNVNPAYERILGITRDRAQGALASEIYGTGEPPYLDLYAQVARTGEPTTFEAHLETTDQHFLVSVFSPARGHFATVFSDTTERTRLEAQVRQMQRLEAVGTLGAGIAHDFNNVLQMIIGRASLMLLEDKDLSDEQRSELANIIDACEQGAGLTRRILTFAQDIEITRAPVALNEAVRQAEAMLVRTVPRMVAIEVDLPERTLTVIGDLHQLTQVVVNLGINAAEAMPDGGSLRIAALAESLDEGALPGLPSGRYAVLQVSDTGTGIDPEDLQHIFDPFFTHKGRSTHSGLGLSVAHGIVTSHGGKIVAQSAVGEGTRFRVYIPVDAAEEPDGAARAVPRSSGPRMVLVIDDEPIVAHLAADMLEHLGHRPLLATEPEVAIELFRSRAAEIDLVLLDWAMPGRSGGTVLRELRAIDPAVPVVICSGHPFDPEARARLAETGVRFLAKPFGLQSLAAALEG